MKDQYHTARSGKAGTLLKMAEQGFNVPPLIVLNAGRCKAVVDQALSDASFVVTTNDRKDVLEARIIHQQLPPQWLQEIHQECLQTFGPNYRISVRSSALNEDRQDASFAGQMKTFLNIGPDKLNEAIVRCLASAYSDSAIEYRKLNGYDAMDGSMEVILQTMVDARISGVLFTMNPNGDHNDMALVVGRGPGEGIVGGHVETDHYYLQRDSFGARRVLDAHIDSKELPLDELKQCGLNAEELFAGPQDMEFSVDLDHKLWILQSRPITQLDTRSIKILDNSNIVESYPGITLPLSFGFARRAYHEVFSACMGPFGVRSRDQADVAPHLQHLLAYHRGRVYYRLDNWYAMIRLVMTNKKSLERWERNMGIPAGARPPGNWSVWDRSRSLFSTFRLILTYPLGNRRFFRRFKVEYERLTNEPQPEWSPAELYAFYESASHRLFTEWAATQVNDFIAFKAFSAVESALENWMSDAGNLANDLMCGMRGVESELPLIELLELKSMVQEEPKWFSRFMHGSPDRILAILQTALDDPISVKFRDYLLRFGDRTLEELKLETIPLTDDPRQLVIRIQRMLRSPHSTDSIRSRQQEIREGARARLNKTFPWYHPKRWILQPLIATSRYGLRSRENMRFARTRAYGGMKQIFKWIGIHMSKQGLIDHPRDVFYLGLVDVEGFCKAIASEDLKQKVERTKVELAQYRHERLPNRILYSSEEPPVPQGDPVPPNADADHFTGIAVSQGKVEGEVLVLEQPDPNVQVQGRILVTSMTDPGWLFLMSQAGGLISEKGSLLSHTAIVGRELGLPTIVGVPRVNQLLKTGDRVRMDGATGKVEIMERL